MRITMISSSFNMFYFFIIVQFLISTAGAAVNQSLPGSIREHGRTGVPAMHAAVMRNGQVVFVDKVEYWTELKLPNGNFAFSSVFDPVTKHLKPLSTQTNAFCCGGSFLADGRLITLGGNAALDFVDASVYNGFRGIRYLDPDATQDGWLEPGNQLASNRWYASAQVLSDGKVFVAAGSKTGNNITNFVNNNPTYEVLDVNGISSGKDITMDILVENQPYWMYPFLHLMTDGQLFIFASSSSQLFDVPQNKVTRYLPQLPGMKRTYPNTGGSVMLPLAGWKHNYNPVIMICGGGEANTYLSPCDASCGLFEPLYINQTSWNMTYMPGPRGMVEGVLLLDGTVLWINGAQQGAEGFGTADKPALDALIYDPHWDTWTVAATSNIARLYHSVALLLLDGTVLIAGSNPNEMPVSMAETNSSDQYKRFPTEFRAEIFTPPYLMGDKMSRRPSDIYLSTKTFRPGSKFFVTFKSPSRAHGLSSADIILYAGGFVTHALHMGQVMFYCESPGWEPDGKGYRMDVRIPNVKMSPGPYVIYVVVDGVPGMGIPVMVKT